MATNESIGKVQTNPSIINQQYFRLLGYCWHISSIVPSTYILFQALLCTLLRGHRRPRQVSRQSLAQPRLPQARPISWGASTGGGGRSLGERHLTGRRPTGQGRLCQLSQEAGFVPTFQCPPGVRGDGNVQRRRREVRRGGGEKDRQCTHMYWLCIQLPFPGARSWRQCGDPPGAPAVQAHHPRPPPFPRIYWHSTHNPTLPLHGHPSTVLKVGLERQHQTPICTRDGKGH